MIYDIRLRMAYSYDFPVAGGRHAVRVRPLERPGAQHVTHAALRFDPPPAERRDGFDFFGNAVTICSYRERHDRLGVELRARVAVERPAGLETGGARVADVAGELARVLRVDGSSPHHFLQPSPAVEAVPAIAAYAQKSFSPGRSVTEAAEELMRRIHDDFAYDPEATDVRTTPREAFEMRRGVCQDFSHVMIAGLRGCGVPAGYVSGYLRTIPPPGKDRLEGADAMHAWVRVWCGAKTGWRELDPTNAMPAGEDHIAAGIGRDYLDVAPIIGRMRMQGGQDGTQSVDVVPVG